MKTVMRNIFLKQMQRFRKIYKDLSYLLERKKLEKVKKLVCGICCSHNTIKTSTKSWFKTKKGTQSNSIKKHA